MKARKTRILADLPARLLSRPRTWIAAGVAGASLMGVVAATAVTPDTLPPDILFERVDLAKRESKELVDAFFAEIEDALERGETVKLSGFGNFELRDKPQRPGRNPKTGEEVPIPPRRVVTFHASQKLKHAVERLTHGEETR